MRDFNKTHRYQECHSRTIFASESGNDGRKKLPNKAPPAEKVRKVQFLDSCPRSGRDADFILHQDRDLSNQTLRKVFSQKDGSQLAGHGLDRGPKGLRRQDPRHS